MLHKLSVPETVDVWYGRSGGPVTGWARGDLVTLRGQEVRPPRL